MADRQDPTAELEVLRRAQVTSEREIERLRRELAEALRLGTRRDEAHAAEAFSNAGLLAASVTRSVMAETDARAAWTRAGEIGTSLGRRIAEGQARLIASQAAVTSLGRANEGLAAGRAAIALREADLRAVIESAIDCAMVTTDHEGLVLAWNSGARRLLGWDEAAAPVMDLAAALPPEDQAHGTFAHELAAALSGEQVLREGWLLRLDGTRVWAGIEAMALRADGHAEPVGVLWMLRDRGGARLADDRLRRILDTEAVGVLFFDASGTLIDANDSFLRMTGYTRNDIAARALTWRTMTPPDWVAATEQQMAGLDATGRIGPYEKEYLLKDGSRCWMLFAGRTLADGTMAEFCIDMTAQRRTEEALRASEARYRTLFDSIDSGFCVIEVRLDAPDGRIDYRVLEANPAFFQQTGHTEAIMGRSLREALPTLEEHWFETYGRIVRTGQPERFEQSADPVGRWFDTHAFPIDAPELRRVAVLFRNVSARRAIDVRLRELNETLEQQVLERTAERDRMWDTSPDLMVVVDFRGYLRRVNPAWTALLGYLPGEVVGHHVNKFVLSEDHGMTLAANVLAAAGGSPRIVNRCRHKDGSSRWISWVAAPARDMTYATGRDVTREKEQEAELAQAQQALRQSQKLEAIGQLTGGIAHDFNNMLQGVAGGLDMARRRMNSGRLDDAARYLDVARDATGRAAGLTRRLLAFARRQRLEPVALDTDTLVQGMTDMLRRTLGPGMALTLDLQDGCGYVTCDANELESALLNLCINARDAMVDGGQLVIATRDRRLSAADLVGPFEASPGEFVEIAVTDTGCGMPAEVLEHALEPFFTTKPLGQGTGLGLSQIYGFVRQSGGALRIESSPGQGTTVRLWLPFTARQDHGAAAPDNGAGAAQDGGGGIILLVDDETGVREPAAARLRDLGYVVVEVADGPGALQRLNEGLRPDLLVTDVGLPGMDGVRVAETVQERLPGLPVLFMTGYATAALPLDAQVVTKPFTLDALTTRVRSAMAPALVGGG